MRLSLQVAGSVPRYWSLFVLILLAADPAMATLLTLPLFLPRLVAIRTVFSL